MVLHHPGWEYRFWTDVEIDAHVRARHPDLHPQFAAYPRGIMRADVFRYLLMLDFGGLYCDLDYEFIRPYDYSGAELILAEEFSRAAGDPIDCIANYIFASAPGHPFWRDVKATLLADPPTIATYEDVVAATGPVFLMRVFEAHAARYPDIRVEEKLVFSPARKREPGERRKLYENGITHGIHLGSGSWKERWTMTYLRRKLGKLLGRRRAGPCNMARSK